MRTGEHAPASAFRWLFLTFLFFLINPFWSQAQDYAALNWYFGNSNEGIRFARPDNIPHIITNKAPLGLGGSAVATDPATGNLLFYTDGVNVYDRHHTLMPNGGGLAGNPAGNQTVVAARVPETASQYYIFTTNPAGVLSYSIVDMTAFGNSAFPAPASGDVTVKNVVLDNNRSEAMLVVPHTNGTDFWLITHESGSPNYTITLFDNSGTVPASTTQVTLGLITQPGNFSYHAPSGHIATSPMEANRSVEVLHFDPASGTLEYVLRVPNSGVNGTNGQAIYDTEWSNNGQYLYLSVFGDAGVQADVLQFDMLNPSTTLTSVLPQPNTIAQSYGLQIAPDSAIYHLYQEVNGGPYLLGSLTNIDTVASEVVYNTEPFESNPDFNAMQFPSFAPKADIEFTVDFTTSGTCANTPIAFYPEVVPTADSLQWHFGDGNSATQWSPVHTYEQGGTFQVEVYAFLNGDTAYATHPITLDAFDLQLTLVQDTTACACELPVNEPDCPEGITPFEVSVQAQGGTPQYQWFGPGGPLPGQTTQTLRPDSAGYYYVAATLGGCTAYAGVNIKEYDSLDQRANIWYFGQNAGIDFNPLPEGPAVPITGPVNSPEGVSVISDRNGQVVFSTDGYHVYDKLGQDITPAGGIGGEPGSTQSALIIPVPGDETLYYIFTTQEIHGTGTYELRYSLFDLKLNNGVGGLAEYNILLFKPSTERITGDDNWLIAHEYGNNTFRAYRVTANGLSNPVISSVGSDHTTAHAESGQGYMKLGAQNRLVVALSTPGQSNVVEIFDFVDSTGVVTNFRTADLDSPTGQVYGVEVSPGGNKLFATLMEGGTSRIYEFAFDSLGNPYYKQDVSQPGQLGAIQIGPDGQLYVAINGSPTLGMFSAVEDTTSLTTLNLQPFDLGGNTSTLGLPNFIQTIANPATSPTFNFAGLCLGDSTVFTASGKDPAIDKFDWVFGDGNSAMDAGPQVSHLYAAAQTYNGVLTIRNRCETPVQQFPFEVTISPPPPDPTNNMLFLCHGSLELDANPTEAPDLTYQWSTGEDTRTITVSQSALYTVTVRDALGCTAEGRFMPSDNRPVVDLGPDQTVCQNTGVAPLDAHNPGADYAWELNGVSSGTDQTHPVSTATPGVFEYKLIVTDPFSTCFVRDSVIFTVNESPAFTLTNNSPIVCNTETGEITIVFDAPADRVFSYFISGPTAVPGGTDQVAGSTISTPATLAGGAYTVTVSDQVSGCASVQTTALDTDALEVVATQFNNCDPVLLAVELIATPGPVDYPVQYRVIDNVSGEVIETGSADALAGNPFTTDPAGIPANNAEYVVEVTMNDGCVATSDPVAVNQDDRVPVTFSIDACSDPVRLEAQGGPFDAVLWTGPGTISSPTNVVTNVADLPQGINEFNLHLEQAGYCARDTTLTVDVNNNVIADFTQSDACADEVLLAATPAGPYTYRWYRDGLLIPGGRILAIGAADNNIQYRVEVVNAMTGCVFTSAPKVVNVSGVLDLTLTATAPCEGQPFTLTATANQTDVSYEWALNGEVLAGQTSATLEETRGGRYDVTVTTAGGGCSITRNFNVTPMPVTEGQLPGSGIICPDPANPDPLTREVTLDAGPDFISYNWLRNGIELNEDGQTYTAFEAGLYSVQLVNIFGCPSTDETLLIEDCTPRITGPNAFRPSSVVEAHGEFANRNFRLFTFFIADEDFEVFIFNRWGEMVYHTVDRDFRWNGGYNNNPGQPLPAGTYTWVVRFKSVYRPDEGIQERRGGVVLLR